MASIDPFTGQETYNANSTGAGIAIDAMQGSGFEAPLAFRMMENLPGLATSVGFSTHRGAGTIMRGGFLDNPRRFSKSKASKFRIIDNGLLSAKNERQFLGGGRGGYFGKRASRLMDSPHAGFAKSARVNNITARPRAFGRFHSLSVFGSEGYTPFGASKMLGGNKYVQSAFAKAGIKTTEGQSLLGPGFFSFVGAGRKADALERRAAKKIASGSELTGRLSKKLGRVDSSIKSLGLMNNPSIAQGYTATAGKTFEFGRILPKSANAGIVAAPYSELTIKGTGEYSANSFVGRSLASGGTQVGVRGNLLASSAYGSGSRYLLGYFRGALGFANVGGLTGEALSGSTKAVSHMTMALGEEGIVGRNGVKLLGKEGADQILERGAFKTLGKEGVMKAIGTKEGAKVLGARALGLAIPGLNIVAAASMAYDLGKMAGEVIKSGINLAKDSVKSMKGTINKPLFGMGYKDTEVAATSRARGVMAIQNSQLNARSALGSEAAMMAAHFG